MRKIAFLLPALLFAAFACTNPAHAEFKWRYFGTAPFAKTRAEAMSHRAEAFRAFGLPPACVSTAIRATNAPGRMEHLNVGDRLAVMMSRGSTAHHDTVIAFSTVRKGIDYAATVEVWEINCEGHHYKIGLPEICFNWSLYPPERNDCYVIPLDYRQTPGTVWGAQHDARVEFHFGGASEAELERLSRDPCFGVRDATGFHKPFHRCAVCGTGGGQWPPSELARAVGLPEKEPPGVFTAPVKDGAGEISLPLSATAYLGTYCVDVETYPVSVAGYEDWTAVTRFDLVTPAEMGRTVPAGRLDRTLSGEKYY